MIINPFKKMQNYIELSREISPSGKLDTKIIRDYLSTQNEYDDIIGLTENKINKGLINTNQISKYFKFDTKTDITTPSEILRKYKEAQTESSINSIAGILKDLVYKNADFSEYQYSDETIKTLKSIEDNKAAIKWLRSQDIVKKGEKIDDPLNHLKDYILGIKSEMTADERLDYLIDKFNNLKITYTFDGQEGRPEALFGIKNYELNSRVTSLNLQNIIRRNIELHTRKKLWHIALGDKSIRKMILDKHLNGILDKSLNEAMKSNYNGIQSGPLDEVIYNMAPQSREELNKQIYKTEETKAKEAYIKNNNNINKVVKTINTLREQANSLISEPNQTGAELFNKTLDQLQFSVYDGMSKTGNISKTIDIVTNMVKQGTVITSFDFETVGSAITEVGFNTAKIVDNNKKMVGLSNLSELIGINKNGDTSKNINDLLAKFKKASKLEKEKIINSNEGYILKYLTMIGNVTGGSVVSALKNESIGLEEDGKKYFSRNFKAQNSVNIEEAEKGLKFFNELHDIQMQNTRQLNEYSIPMHELRLLQKLKDIKSNEEYAIGHNVKAFDLNKLRTFFMTEASEGGRKYYLDNYNKLLNGGYKKLVDSMLLYRAARGPEQIAGSPNVKARLLGETEHTNTAMALRSGIENLNTMHVALNDAETTVKAFLANEDIINFIKEYNTNTNKKNEISNIKTGSILLGTSGNVPSRNGNGVLGFTYDPLFKENNGIRFSHSMLNGDSYTSFADTIKKGSAFEVQGILKINAGKIDTLEILRKIDPQLIGSQDDLYMFVFDQMIDSDHDVSKTKTQRHYWIGTKSDLEEQISTHFEHIADKVKPGEYSIDEVADSVKERWSVNLSTVSPKDMKIYFGETEPGKKYAFSAEYLIDRGKKQAQKDTALSSLRRSTASNIENLLKIHDKVQEKNGDFGSIMKQIIGSQNMAEEANAIFKLESTTQNKLFNVLSLYDMYGSNNINFFRLVNEIAASGVSVNGDIPYNTKNLIYSDTLSNAIDLMQEIVDKSLDSETPLRTKASPVFKYMEDIVELGYKSASSSGKVTYNPSRKNRLRSLQIDLNGANYSIGNKLLASGAYSSQRTKEGAYSAFFSDKAGELGFKSDSGKIYNPIEALNYIKDNIKTIKEEGLSLTKVLKEGHEAGKISYIDRNQYQHNGYDTVNGYMVSMLKAKRIISPTSIRQYQPSRYVVTEENIGEFYNILSPVNQEKFKGVLSNKLNLQHTSYRWIKDNNDGILNTLVYDVLVSGFKNKDTIEEYERNNKQFAKDLKDVKNYAQQFLSALKDKNNGNLGIKINTTSGLAELIVDNIGSGMAIDISKILPSIRYTSNTKDYVMKFGSNVFFNPSVLTKTKHGYDIQSHANIVLSQLQGIFKWIQNTPEDATANDLAGRIEYLGSTIAHELAKKTTPVLSEQDLRHKNNFVYEDFFNLVKEVKNSTAFSQAEINKYLDTEQAKEVIENLTDETKLTDEDKLKLITDRRGIISYITENKALKKSLFRARSSDGIIEDADQILKRMMYSMDIVHKVKPQEDMTATSHGYGDLALSRFGARDPRYAQSVLNRSVEHNGALKTEEELAKLDIKLGRGIYGNAQEAAHARTHSYRALVLNINTEEYFKNYLGREFDDFIINELEYTEDIAEKIKSILTHSVDNNASLINPNQFLAMAKGNITSVTRDREIVDFDNLYYMISRQHRGLIRNAEKQKEATAFVLDLVNGEFNYKSGTYINTHDLTALKESWINELDEDLARRGGILKGGFRRKTQKGDIVSEDDIKKILQNEDFRQEVRSYAEKYGVSEDDAFKKVLSGSKYDLEYIRYVSDIDVAATRKYLISQEKSSAVVAMAGAGSLNKNIREAFKTMGMDQFIGMQLSDEFIDSLEFDGKKFSGLFYEAAFSDTESRSISNKEKQGLFKKALKKAFENYYYPVDTVEEAVDLFKKGLKKERTTAWNIFEYFLRSKGELRYDQHLGAIASTMGDRIKASHGDVITNLTDILVNTNGATEETRNTIIGWFDNGEVNENNVILDKKEGSITLNLDENKQYHLKANKLKETFGEDFFGKKYWYMSFTEANDPKNPGHNLDGPDKGAKIHPLTIGTLEKQRLYQNEVEDVYNRYERLYGEKEAAVKFNTLFEGIAEKRGNEIILKEGHRYGEVLMPETIKSLRNQVWSEFDDSKYRLEVDKKTKKLMYVQDNEKVSTIFDADGNITDAAREELLRRKVSKEKIKRLKNLQIAKDLNLSIDKAVTLSSAIDIKEAYEFNYNLSKYDEHQKAKLVEKMKTDYEFNIIDNISKINTVDRVGTTGNPYSMFNSHVIRLDENIASLVGQDMVAVPYMPTSFKSYTDGSEIKTQVQSKEIDFIRAVEAYTQANASNDKNLSRYENDVRSRFAELNTAIEEAHITKMSVAKDAMTKRAIRSFSAKGNLVRSDIQSGIIPEKMQYAMIDGISLAERAQKNAQVASVFINRENYIRMLGGVDHLKALYNGGFFKDIKIEHFDLDEILDMVNRKGGTIAILRRNPENYQVSNIPVHVFLDRSLAPGKIEAEDKLAALLNLDTDGDQISLAAVLGKHGETGRAMTSAEAMLMNDTSSDSLFRETRRASEIIMSSLAENNVGTEERMKNYVKSAGESAAQFYKTLDSMTVGGNVVDRVMSSVTDNGSIEKMDELRARYREIVSSDKFKAALEKSGVTLKELEQSTETFKSVADEYLRNTGVDSKDQDALMYMWGNMHDTETLAKKLQQNQAGIINMNTARARSIFLQLQNIAEEEGRVIDPNARRSIDAMMIWIEENAQVSKHSGKLSIPELGNAFKPLFGIGKSKTDINHFLDLMETKYNLFDTDETEGKLREQLTQFGYEGKMTKNQMAEYMQSLLPENKVINEEYYNGVERQYVRKSALGWDYDEIRKKEKTALTMYYKGEYSDNSLEKELSELINGMSADGENTLRKIDILSDPRKTQSAYEEKAQRIMERQASFEIPEIDNIVNNIDEVSLKDVAHGAVASIGKVFKSSKGILGLAGSIMAAGFIGGNPTAPSGTEARQAVDDSQPYEIPNMMGDMMPQIGQQAPAGYIINVNASSGKGQDYISGLMQQALRSQFPNQNISMTMNINDSSSNISLRDVASYLKDAI